MTSFLSRRSEDPRTVGMLITASEYAVASVDRLIREAARDAQAFGHLLTNYVDVVFSLEVNFVFPHLPSGERDLLVAIMKTRNALGVQLNGLRQWRTPHQKAEHNQVTADLKLNFVRLRDEILATGMEQRLDERQKQVLLEEFLSIPVDKLSSTSLFFEPSPTDRPAGLVTETDFSRERDSIRGPSGVAPHGVPARRKLQQQEERQGHASAPRPSKEILFLERDQELTSEASRRFVQAGYDVVEADNGFDGYTRAANHHPDLILLGPGLFSDDLSPHLHFDRVVMLKMLSRLSKDRAIPLVVISGGDHSQSKQVALAAGAVACLKSPVDWDQLLKVVRIVLDDIPDPADNPNDERNVVSASV